VHIRPRGLLGEWVKYNQNIFIYTLFGNSPTGQTRQRNVTHDGSNDADSRKGVPFLGFVHMAFLLGSQNPQNNHFGA